MCICKLDGNRVVGGQFPEPRWRVEDGGGAVERAGRAPDLFPRNPLVPSEVRRLHLQHLMILTGPTRAPSGLLCLPDQWPLSWAHPSVTRSSSCSQPLEQPRPVTTTNWLSTAAWRPFSAIVCGQMSFPLHTAPAGPARAACCFWERGSLSFSRKPS